MPCLRLPAVVLLALLPTLALAGDKQPPSPAEYPLTVHVVASRVLYLNNQSVQQLFAVVDGRQVELEGTSAGVLALGDYKARLDGSFTPTKPNAYDIKVAYEFLFPDGHTRPYGVVGLGFVCPAATAGDR
jgi:hypothetical protein